MGAWQQWPANSTLSWAQVAHIVPPADTQPPDGGWKVLGEVGCSNRLDALAGKALQLERHLTHEHGLLAKKADSMNPVLICNHRVRSLAGPRTPLHRCLSAAAAFQGAAAGGGLGERTVADEAHSYQVSSCMHASLGRQHANIHVDHTSQGTCFPPQVWAAIMVCTQLPDAKQAVELQWRLLLVHVSTCCWALRRQRVGPALLRCLPCL